jgi:predicted permease
VSLVSIFATAILPVLAVAGLGFALGRVHDVDADPIATVTVHVLTPALAFYSVATTDLSGGTLARIAVGLVVFVAVMAVVAEGVGRFLGVAEPFRSALVLLVVFPNAGNYGIPLSDFAFGPVGRSTALVYMTAQIVVMYTFGVYVAARSGTADWTAGVKRVITVPLVYAVAAALAGRALGVIPPADGAAMETVQLVGDAAIPLMLVVLLIELARADYTGAVRTVGATTVLKLAVAPVVGLGLAAALGFGDSTVTRTFALESATPSAVTPLVLLVEFGDADPVDGVTVSEFASTVLLVGMIASVPTVTLLVSLLRSGVV